MATMTIKNIPEDLYAKIRQRATDNGRSINNEVIFCLRRSFLGGPVDTEALLAKLKALREEIPLPPLTDEILRSAKEEGRP